MPDYTIQTLCLQSMVRVSGPVPFVSGRCVICCCRACVVVYASQTAVCSIPSLVSTVVTLVTSLVHLVQNLTGSFSGKSSVQGLVSMFCYVHSLSVLCYAMFFDRGTSVDLNLIS